MPVSCGACVYFGKISPSELRRKLGILYRNECLKGPHSGHRRCLLRAQSGHAIDVADGVIYGMSNAQHWPDLVSYS
jgi:hypothetical protein